MNINRFSTGCDSCQNVFLEENVSQNCWDHDYDDTCCQCLPGSLLCIRIIHQECSDGTQLVLRHIQIRDVHVVDDVDGLHDTYRGCSRCQQRENNLVEQLEIGTAIQQCRLIQRYR